MYVRQSSITKDSFFFLFLTTIFLSKVKKGKKKKQEIQMKRNNNQMKYQYRAPHHFILKESFLSSCLLDEWMTKPMSFPIIYFYGNDDVVTCYILFAYYILIHLIEYLYYIFLNLVKNLKISECITIDHRRRCCN